MLAQQQKSKAAYYRCKRPDKRALFSIFTRIIHQTVIYAAWVESKSATAGRQHCGLFAQKNASRTEFKQ